MSAFRAGVFPGVWALLLRSCSDAFVVSFSVWLATLDSSTPTPRRAYVYLFPRQYFRRLNASSSCVESTFFDNHTSRSRSS